MDPRSPTVEFTRTPIVLGDGSIKPRNKNLDLVRQQLTNFSPMKPHGTEINPTRTKGPILLGVSPITKKLNQEKRKSYIGLLETDLDFVETDLDEVKPKPQIKEGRIEEEQERIGEQVQIEEERIDEPEQIEEQEQIKEEQIIDNDEPKEKILKTDLEITDPETIQTTDNDTSLEEQNKILAEKEMIISPIKQTLEKINQIDEDIKEVIAIAHNSNQLDIDDETSSNAFDKKVSNLIYEDQQIVNIPKNIKQNNGGNRTPLGVRNVNQSNKKSVSKLRVHDKPTMNKNEFAVSKIPVFKEKKGKSKIAQQCENTPPRQMTDIKHRKTQWDADKTLII